MANILIADDEDYIRKILCDLLSGKHSCDLVATAEQALTCLAGGSYDVIITDISMPGLSGLELLGHIRQTHPNTPVIVVSGISDEAYATGLIKMGAFHYLMKPFSLSEVEEVTRRAARRSRELGAREAAPMRSAASPSEKDATRELMVLERQWADAYKRSNIAVLDSIWAEDFVYTSPFGEVRNKEEAMQMLRSEISYEFFVNFDIKGSIFENTAVASGRAVIKGGYNGEDISGEYRYTNTYARREGAWQSIASHIIRVEQI
ncbi:MAG TPA: response regulator [Pyrinomonadaceae bacterium]|nr:response regulator [Pyrinomonadaceae bacterium]